MIRVRKPRAPAGLERGTGLTEENCAAYVAHGSDYLNGKRKFEFNRSIYGHESVKSLLKKAHHSKCCYCEGKFEAHAFGDVEHYRPKGAVRQDRNSATLYPGYYWLAYSWRNLFYVCRICNTRKSSFFPLADPAKRARSHTDNLAHECPLILDPGGPDDPRNHIGFQGELASGTTKAGNSTIRALELNRNELGEARLHRLKVLQTLLCIISVLDGNQHGEAEELLEKSRLKLCNAVEPVAEYSSMAADFLSNVSIDNAAQNMTS